jgi:hypothetical protein
MVFIRLSLQQAVMAHRIVGRRGFRIFWTVGLQMAVKLSVSRSGRPSAPVRFVVLIPVGSFNRRQDHSAPERIRLTEKSSDPSEIEPATFRHEA